MVDDASVLLWIFFFGTEFPCYPSLNLGCGYFLGKAHHPPKLSEMSYTLSPHSLNLRDSVSPQIALLGGLWEVISLPFCLLRQAWIWNWVFTSLMRGASLPLLVPVPHQIPLCIRGLHPNLPGGQITLQSSCLLATGGISSWQSKGHIPVIREVITHHLHNPRQAPKKCWGKLLAEIWDTEAV
jgi:hypothetical protein